MKGLTGVYEAAVCESKCSRKVGRHKFRDVSSLALARDLVGCYMTRREMPGWDRLSSWLDLNSIHLSDAPSPPFPLLSLLPQTISAAAPRKREEERVLWFTKFGVWYIPCGVLSKFPVITTSPPRSKPWVARRKTLIRGPVDFESSIFGRFVRLLSLSPSESRLCTLRPTSPTPLARKRLSMPTFFSAYRLCRQRRLVGFWSVRSSAIPMYIRIAIRLNYVTYEAFKLSSDYLIHCLQIFGNILARESI